MNITESHKNNGQQKEIIAMVTESHQIAIKPEDIISHLSEGMSDTLAKLINKMGEIYPESHMGVAMSINDLDDKGREFIEMMHYFLHSDS